MRQLKKNACVSGLAAGLLVLAGAAEAQGPNYNYLQGGYVNIEIDDGDFDVDGGGFSLDGSFAVTDMVHVFGGYTNADLDDVDVERIRLGAGLNYAINSTTDLVGTLYYVDYEADVPGPGDADEDGFGLTAGVRSMLTPQFEVNALIRYEDLGGELDDETSLGLGALYTFVPNVAVYGNVEVGDDITEYGVGVRWYFR